MAWLAALLFAVAPAVSAVCALDAHGGSSDPRAAMLGDAGLPDSGGHDEDSCCATMSAPVIESSKPSVASLVRSIQPVGPPVAAGREAGARVLFVARRLTHASTPPPEPVSRRFPRLLI